MCILDVYLKICLEGVLQGNDLPHNETSMNTLNSLILVKIIQLHCLITLWVEFLMKQSICSMSRRYGNSMFVVF